MSQPSDDRPRRSADLSVWRTSSKPQTARLHAEQEPEAAGRDAFWLDRPIWTNPLTGGPAREWTAGWKRGAAELEARRGGLALPTSASARQRLLNRYRPEDVATPVRQERRSSPEETSHADA
jgi:hypothetical protein